jgi:hypothetical protein
MTPEPVPPAVPEVAGNPPAGAPAPEPARLLRISRGFSSLFWSLPLLSMAHTAAMVSLWPAGWMVGAFLGCFLPLLWGLWLMRAGGDLTPRWRAGVSRALRLALVAIYLCAFLVWWRLAPLRLYFGVNAALHYLATIALLAGLNRLAGEFARGLGDAALRRESGAGLLMVLWLSGCTVGALAWLLHRTGLLAAGAPAVLAQLAALPREAGYLLLLPYAMTAYVMWRAKEAGFARAIGAGP